MSRLPGVGVAQSLIALVFLAAVAVVGAASLGVLGNGPAGASPSPTAIAAEPTPSDSSDPQPTPSEAPPKPTPETSPTPAPSGDVVAYTNPDGISPDGFVGDDYPFIEMAQNLPTYGTLWVDPNQRDIHIGLTGDIAGAIDALKDGIPRGITVYFYIVEYTQAELCAIRDAMFEDREELMRHGIVLTWGGCGNSENRVNVGMSPTSPEAIAYMQQRYPGPVDYENGGASWLRPFDPPAGGEVRLIAIREGDDLGLLTCGGRPFLGSALDARPRGIGGPGAEFAALREDLEIYVDIYGDLSGLPWTLAEKDAFGATFLARQGDRWLEAPVFAGKEDWIPGTIDDCIPREFGPEDYGEAEWRLDPNFPEPTSESIEIHVLVTESACAGGKPPYGRVTPPLVSYSANNLDMTIGVRHGGGLATCPSNPSLPVTIVLPEPIGDRALEGGSPAVP